MRIGIVSPGDPRSLKIWSGTTAHMLGALERHCGEVVPLRVTTPRQLWGRGRARMARILGRPSPAYRHSLPLAREQAAFLARCISRAGPLDLLFAPAASDFLAFLETRLPVVYTSDTTFELIHEYYGGYWTGSERDRAEGHEIERRALRRADLVLFPSPWPIASARESYGTDPARIHVFPYGANLSEAPSRTEALAPKAPGPLRLLWIGRDWERKGGPVAVETVRVLRGWGIDARLTLVGCHAPVAEDDAIRIVPDLHKADPSQAAEFRRLLLDAHFLVLPTRAECYGMVFCEASAHGTPSLATDTGGVCGAVHPGKNGFLLPVGAGPAVWAERIHSAHADAERYRALCVSSRELYEAELNWDAWGRRVHDLLPRRSAGKDRERRTAAPRA